MWLFNNSVSLQGSGIFQGFTDWHCHLLPGVDDGVQTIDESLEILRRYEALGVKEIWLTPHIMEDVPNTTAHLRQRFAELQASYHGSVKLNLSAENMLDNLFEERLAENDLLPIGNNGNHLLVETSYFNPPMGFHDILKRIKAKGYHPVLAHPERYTYMGEKDYRTLKDMNIKFQLNLFSLVGYYGPQVRKKAEWLLTNSLYDLCGADIHSVSYFDEPIRQNIQCKQIQLLHNIVYAID